MRPSRNKILFLFALGFGLLASVIVVPPALAQLSAINEGLSYGTIVGWSTQDLRVTIMKIIQVLFWFLGVVSVLIILYAGWKWMTSGGDPQKIDDAKRTLVNAALGLLVIFSAFAIVTFIIQMLTGATGPQGLPRNPPPSLPCTNCEALGTGLVEYVYPEPGSTNVARNTNIIVGFKVDMDVGTIIAGTDIRDNIDIQVVDPITNIPGPALPTTEVKATAAGLRHFTFDPVNYLGDGVNDVRYRISLDCNITHDGGNATFTRCEPGTNTGFSWDFVVSPRLDFDPPQIESVFPEPDNAHDTYGGMSAPVQAQGSFKVSSRPQTAQVARVGDMQKIPNNVNTPGASFVSADYSCGIDATVCVQFDGTNYDISVHDPSLHTDAAGTCAAAQLADRAGWFPRAVTGGPSAITLGCGVTIRFSDATLLAGGQQWRFHAIARRTADTLRIGNAPTFTFVDGAPADAIQIEVGPPTAPKTAIEIAANIAARLTGGVESPNIDGANGGTDVVTLTAAVAGVSGNGTQIFPSGTWASNLNRLGTVTLGADAAFSQTKQGQQLDKARNAIPRVDFNEAILPSPVSGKVSITDAAEPVGQPNFPNVGSILPANAPFVTVQADLDENGVFDAYEYVEGTFIISNRFQTVEFQPITLCGVCQQNGASCTKDLDCGAAAPPGSCKTIRNSCGDQVFCLPTVQPAAANSWVGYTQYKMVVHAATLYECNVADVDPTNDCNEKSFPTCSAAPGICENGAGRNYPLANSPIDGAVDAANNSLDGSGNGEAEGKSTATPYYSYPTGPGNPDSAEWTFWINNRINLQPPKIVVGTNPSNDGISPNMDVSTADAGIGLPITVTPSADFEEPALLSSSLVPDNHYRDGRCGCGADTECRQSEGEQCDDGSHIGDSTPPSNVCRKKSGIDNFCRDNEECKGGTCFNRQHVTLKDFACSSGGRCSGWWVGNAGHDTDTPLDGYPDWTEVMIGHTPLAEYSRYGVELGSGIKDQYQNCFLPSEGPNRAGAACVTTRTLKYCCDGTAQATECLPR